jgi:cytoskeletal protein CcmA (bactofilin family)
MLVLFVAVLALDANAAGRESVSTEIGSDRFAAGGTVVVAQPVEGDVIAAGGNVRVSGAVKGDAVLAGGHVELEGDVAQGLYAAGGEVRIEAGIARNARLAGGQVEIGARGHVDGNLTVAGGDVAIRGAVKGYLQAAGGRVLIDAPVGGNVVVRSGHLTLGPHARIDGSLQYRGSDLVRDDAAVISGGLTLAESSRRGTADRARRGFAYGAWIWTAGLMVMAALLAGALPRVSRRFAPAVAMRPGLTVLTGFVALVAVPAAAAVFMVTIIGIPLGLLTLLAWLMLLLVGYVAAAVALGDSALGALKPGAATGTAARAGAAILAVLVLALLTRIPFVGAFLGLATLIVGLGAVLLSSRPAMTAHASPQPAT